MVGAVQQSLTQEGYIFESVFAQNTKANKVLWQSSMHVHNTDRLHELLYNM